MKLCVFTDGGARGNPGSAAVGVVIKTDEEKIIASFGKCIGETTNNVAEYTAVVEALRWIACHSERSEESPTRSFASAQDDRFTPQNDISFFLDSSLVVNQLNGLFKTKDSKLRELALAVHQLETEIKIFPTYNHIPREKNWQADKLVNEALDLPASPAGWPAGRQVSFHVPSADTEAQKD